MLKTKTIRDKDQESAVKKRRRIDNVGGKPSKKHHKIRMAIAAHASASARA